MSMLTYEGKYGSSSFTPLPLAIGLLEMEMLLNHHASAIIFCVDEGRYTIVADSYPVVTLEASLSDYGN